MALLLMLPLDVHPVTLGVHLHTHCALCVVVVVENEYCLIH